MKKLEPEFVKSVNKILSPVNIAKLKEIAKFVNDSANSNQSGQDMEFEEDQSKPDHSQKEDLNETLL